MLEQIRATIADYIQENPYTISTAVYPTRTNEYGIKVKDFTKTPVTTELGTVRIARRRIPDSFITNPATPYDWQDVYYLITEYTAATWLTKDIEFTYYDKQFRTLFPESRIICGGVAYYLCDLEQTNSLNVGDL